MSLDCSDVNHSTGAKHPKYARFRGDDLILQAVYLHTYIDVTVPLVTFNGKFCLE